MVPFKRRWPRRWSPLRGRYTLAQLIRAHLEESIGPVHVDDLLRHLQGLGFYVPTTRRILDQFVQVDEAGHVSLRRGG